MSDLLIEREQGYAVLTLNRPDARNALSPQLLTDLCAAFRDLQREQDVRAVILTGTGSAFCAGLDLKALSGSDEGTIMGDCVCNVRSWWLHLHHVGWRSFSSPCPRVPRWRPRREMGP